MRKEVGRGARRLRRGGGYKTVTVYPEGEEEEGKRSIPRGFNLRVYEAAEASLTLSVFPFTSHVQLPTKSHPHRDSFRLFFVNSAFTSNKPSPPCQKLFLGRQYPHPLTVSAPSCYPV